MPRWDWILVSVLAAVTAGWGISVLVREPSEGSLLRAVYDAECPEYAAAATAAFAGYGLDEIPPKSVHTEKLNEWRTGDPRAVQCRILYVQAGIASRADWQGARGSAPDTTPWMSAFDQSYLFELMYYRWRATGDGLEELEAMARTMERRWVESALWQHQFHEDAVFPVVLTQSLTISPDDPGHRFVKLAPPDTPETAPPDERN